MPAATLPTQLEGLGQVIPGEGDYSSRLVSLVDKEPGSIFAKIEGSTEVSDRSYTTVQIREDQDIELNSDLVFINHSCDPNVAFDMSNFEVRVIRPLRKGEDITFFYPSTEWNMQQPFKCGCGTERCLGSISGASHLDDDTLKQYWLNEHIQRLLAQRAGRKDSAWSES